MCDRLLRIINMPSSTPPAIVWREFWLAGFDVPHPAPDQTLERWIESLPEQLSSRKRRTLECITKFAPDSTNHSPQEGNYEQA